MFKKVFNSFSNKEIKTFLVDQQHPLVNQHYALAELMEIVHQKRSGKHFFGHSSANIEAFKTIKAAARDEQAKYVHACIERLKWQDQLIEDFCKKSPGDTYNLHLEKGWDEVALPRFTLSELLESLLRRQLPLSEQVFIEFFELAQQKNEPIYYLDYSYSGILKNLEFYKKKNSISDVLSAAIEKNARQLVANNHTREAVKLSSRLFGLIEMAPQLGILNGEAWSDEAIKAFRSWIPKKQEVWARLLGHCEKVSGGKPAKKWAETAKTLAQTIPEEDFCEAVLNWFALVDQPRNQIERSSWEMSHEYSLADTNMDYLKGLVWFCIYYQNKELSRALRVLAISSFKKIPERGPRAPRVGNACIYVLGQDNGLDGVEQLALLKVKIRNKNVQKGIEKALNETAQRIGVPEDELEEMSVPDYGMPEVGLLEEAFGDYRAQVKIEGVKTSAVQWLHSNGKQQKSIPKAVSERLSTELKEFKATVKDIQKMLPAQKERLDKMFLDQKKWEWQKWRDRYIDHPLVGSLGRRLIWKFNTTQGNRSGCFFKDQFVDHHGTAVLGLDESVTVELWHPIDAPVEEVMAWRHWLSEYQIRQPFKQAHREIYILTDAEKNTDVYSNRFAAHIIKQHQFNALCGARGWKNQLRLMVDDEYPPASRSLEKWGLRAEFWIEGIGDNYGVHTNDAGTFLYLATDQVRFYAVDTGEHYAHAGGGGYRYQRGGNEGEPISLDQIPPLVLSEILRDVDLFVGVASVGNDPNWSDGGPELEYRDYWNSYSFGDLSETATTRKEILELLIPKLKIAKQCEVSDKFLIVKGVKRTYKIHFGSGNILMEPNDQYLCIVSKSSATTIDKKVFLPFEGDNMLSIIISKALLLAEDDKIKDQTILSQIDQ